MVRFTNNRGKQKIVGRTQVYVYGFVLLSEEMLGLLGVGLETVQKLTV